MIEPITQPIPNGQESAVIALRNVTRGFERQPVLRNLSFEIHRGETVVLIGESGCGKSVTMKLMIALLKPDLGEVTWSGRNVDDLSAQQIARERLRFGYLFQGSALFDSLSVFENVAFGLRENTALPEEQIQELVCSRLRDVGLPQEICSKKPVELSGGMKKRVGLARALALSPEVVFYDEPTTGLDPIMSDVINELILQTRSSRPVTSIVVTHDMRTVEKVADRVIMLRPLSRLAEGESQIAFEGSPEEAFSSTDPIVLDFVTGQAGERIQELSIG